jgi:hypothetical protein
MLLKLRENSPPKWFPIIAFLVVYPLWIWLAVRTRRCMEVISGHSIPYSRRTIWLIKILALIVGAGGVAAAVMELGVPWFFAILPAGIIVFFAFRENVQQVAPSKLPQDSAAYELAWRQYERLRGVYRQSWKWFGGAFVILIAVAVASSKLPETLRLSLIFVCFVAAVALMYVTGFNYWRLQRWPCPRCGCAFRGFWGRPWLPKSCVYCGLERWAQDPRQQNT